MCTANLIHGVPPLQGFKMLHLLVSNSDTVSSRRDDASIDHDGWNQIWKHFQHLAVSRNIMADWCITIHHSCLLTYHICF